MGRALLFLNLLLALVLGGLWWLDGSLESRFETKRRSVSIFLPLATSGAPTVASVARIELMLPGSSATWVYAHEKDGWHLPEYRGAFARSAELEAILKALLDGRGTIVGRVPADAAHFGLEAAEALHADLFDVAGDALLLAQVGRVAPGGRQSESFMAAKGSDVILHMNANPWSSIQWKPGVLFPPLLDMRVIPLALGRRSAREITLAGPGSGALKRIERREVPEDPRLGMRGPSYEWYGAHAADPERRLNDRAAFAYARSLAALAFDEFVGTRRQHPAGFEQPALIVTLNYDGDATDTLTLGARTAQGLHRLHQSTTDQVFLINAQKAQALRPNLDAFLEANAGAPAGPPPGASIPGIGR